MSPVRRSPGVNFVGELVRRGEGDASGRGVVRPAADTVSPELRECAACVGIGPRLSASRRVRRDSSSICCALRTCFEIANSRVSGATGLASALDEALCYVGRTTEFESACSQFSGIGTQVRNFFAASLRRIGHWQSQWHPILKHVLTSNSKIRCASAISEFLRIRLRL